MSEPKCDMALRQTLKAAGFRVSALSHGPRYHADEEQMLNFARKAQKLPSCLKGRSPLCGRPFQGHETSIGSFCRNDVDGSACGHRRACHSTADVQEAGSD